MTINLKRRRLMAAMGAMGAVPATLSFPALAQNDKAWPNKTVKLLVGFPAGGGADGMARLMATKLSDRLGQQFIVENRSGATGTICSQLVAKSDPDGYTLQLAHINSNVIGPLMVAKGRFDPINSFTPIGLIGIAPQLLVHSTKLQFSGIPDLIKYAKANPGRLTFASSGNGSVQHVAGEAFMLAAGVEMQHIPFKGTGEAMASLLSGDVDLSFSSAASVVQNIKVGKLKLLATCTPKRLALYPDTPTIAETLRGYDISTWYGMAGPAKLPADIVAKLNSEISAIVQLPDVAKRFKDLSEEVATGTPEQFGQFWRAELDKYAKLIRDAKIQTT